MSKIITKCNNNFSKNHLQFYYETYFQLKKKKECQQQKGHKLLFSNTLQHNYLSKEKSSIYI